MAASDDDRPAGAVGRAAVGSRLILLVFYFGLAIGLAVYAVAFAAKLVKMAANVLVYDQATMILAMLGLIDAVLVANLVVTVVLSGWRSFIRDRDGSDAGSGLKVKVASSIVAISAIHLLQLFFNAEPGGERTLLVSVAVHLAFVASALMLAVIDRLGAKAKG
ncbi:MAG: YqhA family protein [Sphingomonadaceae bacterium]|nr:YqhA family protein [Sphingomonadaceae bacterium]